MCDNLQLSFISSCLGIIPRSDKVILLYCTINGKYKVSTDQNIAKRRNHNLIIDNEVFLVGDLSCDSIP